MVEFSLSSISKTFDFSSCSLLTTPTSEFVKWMEKIRKSKIFEGNRNDPTVLLIFERVALCVTCTQGQAHSKLKQHLLVCILCDAFNAPHSTYTSGLCSKARLWADTLTFYVRKMKEASGTPMQHTSSFLKKKHTFAVKVSVEAQMRNSANYFVCV